MATPLQTSTGQCGWSRDILDTRQRFMNHLRLNCQMRPRMLNQVKVQHELGDFEMTQFIQFIGVRTSILRTLVKYFIANFRCLVFRRPAEESIKRELLGENLPGSRFLLVSSDPSFILHVGATFSRFVSSRSDVVDFHSLIKNSKQNLLSESCQRKLIDSSIRKPFCHQ